MRLVQLQTGTRILASFCIVSLAIAVVTAVALWRMHASDAITSNLVNDKLAKQQLDSELLGVVRLNGLRVVSIGRSDSLELSDYYQAQLAAGEKVAAAIEARLSALPATPAEQGLLRTAAQRKQALAGLRRTLFKLKDTGQVQQVEQLLGGDMEQAFNGYTAALEALLSHESREARGLAAESARAFALGRVLLLVLGVCALATGGVLAWILTRSIVGPLQQAVALAEQVARGDLRATIGHARRDEIGRLFDALNHMTGGVSATVSRVLAGARDIDRTSAEIAAGNQDLSQRTERQAGSLERTASSMQELTAAVASNSASAQQANALAQSASTVVAEAARAVGQVVEKMGTIKLSAARIADITAVIDGIAFQTNILALNAAVEAARAGPEGRGFAVVAGEVRNLAQHSAAAARDIKKLIGESTSEIVAGTGIANAAGETMREVLERVRHVTRILASIDAASAEQAAGVAAIDRSIAEIEGATRQNAAMVEQAAAAADSMRVQASELANLVGTFRLEAESGAGARVTLPAASWPACSRPAGRY